MAVRRIDVRVRSAATPARVYALVSDGTSWLAWTPFLAFELAEPERRFGYALLSGLPQRDHRAGVDLTPVDGGTEIRWHSTFRPRAPGTGWLYRRALETFIRPCAQGLAEYAARP
ncbi:hypothetical protein JOF53_002849 [Crossiella equi]|uniref:SRPBCC family protein n=1 Tax=Crossiella equi TaxID=130796 RepID=A0ABS5ABL6_9PSEU|nr:SRPBCC family protein [Crossiella equi]MBP2473977.1 hypothetical protein [Crossiella equi]